MNIGIYYESGNYGTIDTTMLSFQDGHLLDDNFVDTSDLAGVGLAVTRGTYTTDATGGRMVLTAEPVAIVRPEELEGVSLVTVDGKPLILKVDGVWTRPILDMVRDLAGDGEDG